MSAGCCDPATASTRFVAAFRRARQCESGGRHIGQCAIYRQTLDQRSYERVAQLRLRDACSKSTRRYAVPIAFVSSTINCDGRRSGTRQPKNVNASSQPDQSKTAPSMALVPVVASDCEPVPRAPSRPPSSSSANNERIGRARHALRSTRIPSAPLFVDM